MCLLLRKRQGGYLTLQQGSKNKKNNHKRERKGRFYKKNAMEMHFLRYNNGYMRFFLYICTRIS